MNAIALNDLSLNNELDRDAMSALTGGASVLIPTGVSYSGWSSTYLGSSQQLTGLGYYNGKWAKFYRVKKRYKQSRFQTKHYKKVVWN